MLTSVAAATEAEDYMPAPFFRSICLQRMDLADLKFLAAHRLVARSVDYVQCILSEVFRRADKVESGMFDSQQVSVVTLPCIKFFWCRSHVAANT